jgi:hypothetical protein
VRNASKSEVLVNQPLAIKQKARFQGPLEVQFT